MPKLKDRPAYLPLYVRDFWTDPNVLVMAWLEQAIYLRMLMLSWEAGALPDDLGSIEHMIGLGSDQRLSSMADSIELVLETCWTHVESGWTNPRLEFERTRWHELHATHSRNGSKGNAVRWGIAEPSPGDSQAIALGSQSQAQAHTQVQAQELEEEKNPPTPRVAGGTPPGKTPKKKKPAWSGSIPSTISKHPLFAETWKLWLRFRAEEKRSAVTQISGDQALERLSSWGADRAIAAIKHTMANGWLGIREPEPERKNGFAHAGPSDASIDIEQRRIRKELGIG